jgi:biopolymer transport protein ExbB/TolQ
MSTSMSHLVEAVLAAAPALKGGAVDSIIRFFKEGGPFMYVNVFWMACAIAVVVERVVTLMFRYNLNAGPFMEQITKLVMAGNPDRAVKLCGAAPNASLSRVIRAGLTRANRGEQEVARALEEAILEHTPPIRRASLALVAGQHRHPGGAARHHQRSDHHLQSLGNVPADQKQAILANGISEAMNNTAFGLGIAVSCIIAHLFLTAYAKKMVETVELSALKLENLLSRRAAGETSAMDFERSA